MRCGGSAVLIALGLVSSIPAGRGQPASALPGPTPVYAFDGAWAAYRVKGGTSDRFAVVVDDVDVTARSFRVTVQLGRVPSPFLTSQTNETFDRHPSLEALAPSELAQLEQNLLPSSLSMPLARFTHRQTVSVPAGRFVTEEVSQGGLSLWFDRRSGLLVKSISDRAFPTLMARFVGSAPTSGRAEVELVATNIPLERASSRSWSSWAAGGAVLVAGFAAVGWIWMRRRSGAPRAGAVAAQATLTGSVLDRIAELKSMLDQGLITREEFQREKGRLLGVSR